LIITYNQKVSCYHNRFCFDIQISGNYLKLKRWIKKFSPKKSSFKTLVFTWNSKTLRVFKEPSLASEPDNPDLCFAIVNGVCFKDMLVLRRNTAASESERCFDLQKRLLTVFNQRVLWSTRCPCLFQIADSVAHRSLDCHLVSIIGTWFTASAAATTTSAYPAVS
jgi:hypothetical protein